MTTYALLAMGFVVIVVGLALRWSVGTARLMADLGDREAQIDGLRGLVALVVACHHLMYFYGWYGGAGWEIPPADHGLVTMGKAGVAVFFLICAYLFWGKLARAHRGGLPLGFGALMRNRVRRLVPMYAVAMVAAMGLVGLGTSGLVLRQGIPETAMQVAQSLSFSFFGNPVFNGSFLAYAAIGVSWSLEYEWVFYASLPLLRILRVVPAWMVALPLVVVLNELMFRLPYLDYFAYGALCYEAGRSSLFRRLAASPVADMVSICAFLFVVAYGTPYAVGIGKGPPLLALSFLPIACGATWFGFLRLRPLRLLGLESYSLYLSNIVIFFLAFEMFESCTGVSPSIAYAPVMLLSPVAVSLATYRFIERPFLPLPGPAPGGLARLAAAAP